MPVVLNEAKIAPFQGAKPKPSKWGMPGGGVDEGESIAHAAVREMEEEAGLIFQEKDVVELFREPSLDTDHENIQVLMTGTPQGALRPGDGVIEARWIYTDELGILEEGFYRGQQKRLERVGQMERVEQILNNEA